MDEQVSLPNCVTDNDGTKHWRLNDKRHREDGPAIIWTDGYKEWWLNGKRHRENGPAIMHSDGTKLWYLNGKRHRENGPAVINNDGSKFWCINDKLHREDGPAIVCADGTKLWFLNGKQIHHPSICSFVVANKVEQKLFASEHSAGRFMIEKLGEGIVAWLNL